MTRRSLAVIILLLLIIVVGIVIISQRRPEASVFIPTMILQANDDGPVFVQQAKTVDINPLANDTNIETGIVTILVRPNNGSVEVGDRGINSYSPKDNFIGEDSYVYKVCAINGQCDSANVSILVVPTNPLQALKKGSAELKGTKFFDVNENGKFDSNEPGLADWIIYIDQNNNSILDTSEVSKTTDSNGNFAFTDLASGNYIVRQVQQNDWTSTAPANGNYARSIENGNQLSGLNFGSVGK